MKIKNEDNLQIPYSLNLIANCTECAPGFCPDIENCTACSPGTFNNVLNATHCLSCSDGYYSHKVIIFFKSSKVFIF